MLKLSESLAVWSSYFETTNSITKRIRQLKSILALAMVPFMFLPAQANDPIVSPQDITIQFDSSAGYTTVEVRNNATELIISSRSGEEAYVGEVKLVSKPAAARSTPIPSKKSYRVIENEYTNIGFFIVGDQLIFHRVDGDMVEHQSITVPELLNVSSKADFRSFYPEARNGVPNVLTIRDVENAVVGTYLYYHNKFYRMNNFILDLDDNAKQPIRVKAIEKGYKLIVKLNDGEELQPTRLMSKTSPKYSADNLLSDPKISNITLPDGNKGQITLLDFLHRQFKFVSRGTAFPEDYQNLNEEIQKSLRALVMKNGGSVAVLGRPGTGKTYFADVLVSYIVEGKGPKELQNRLYIKLANGDIAADVGLVGLFEMKIRALKMLSGIVPVTLLIDEMHTLVGAGAHRDNRNDFFQMLKEDLARGNIKIIGTTTDNEWDKYFSGDQAFTERFPIKIKIAEPNLEKTVSIIDTFRGRHYGDRSFEVPAESLKSIAQTASRFDPIGSNPRKSLRLAEYVFASMVVDNVNVLTEELVRKFASQLYGFDLNKYVPEKISENLKVLRQKVDSEIVGLEKTKDVIQLALGEHFFKQLVKEESKPTGILIYGRRGVGKTVFSQTIAKGLGFQYNRIMMSQYAHPSDVSAFKSKLGLIIRANPFSVVLFDEIEKAHPAVQQSLLDLMDSGKFEASLSKIDMHNSSTEIDGSKVIFIAATNAAQSLADREHSFAEFEREALADGLNRYLLDRFSTITPLESPNKQAVHDILKNKWQKIAEEFERTGRSIDVNVNDLIQYVESLVRSQNSTGPGIGFGNKDNSGTENELSVRSLERELLKVSQNLSLFFFQNSQERLAKVTFSGGKVIVTKSGDSDPTLTAPKLVSGMTCDGVFR